MFLSRTNTAPTLARLHVERSATWRVINMKYWSQVGLWSIANSFSGAHPNHRRNQLIRLRPAPSFERRDRHRYEGDHEQRQRQPAGQSATRIEARHGVGRRRVIEPDEQHQNGPEKPSGPTEKTEAHGEQQEQASDPAMLPPEHGIDHVPSVELADGEEIEH